MKWFKLLWILFAGFVLATSCINENPVYRTDETTVLTVFVYNSLTGDAVSSRDLTAVEYTNQGLTKAISIEESAAGVITGSDHDTSLKLYNFEAGETIKLVIYSDKYHRFEAYPQAPTTNKYPVFSAYLIPSSISETSPAYSVELRNSSNGALVTDGQYLLTANTNPTLVSQGGAGGPTVLSPYIPPNYGGSQATGTLAPVYGSVGSTGTITFSAGTLYPGIQYNLQVFGSSGFQTLAAVNAFTVGVTPESEPVVVSLTYTDTKTLALVAVGHIDSLGALKAPTPNRRLSFTFNYNIEISYAGVLGTALSALVAISTANNDGDATTTTAAATAAPAATELATGLSITATDNVLTIELSATDADLTSVIDLDDSLSWNLDAIADLVFVRRSNAAELTAWSSLTSFAGPAGYNPVNENFVVVRVY